METGIDATLFISTVVIALTEIIRRIVPAVTGVVTIVTAGLVGMVVGAIDQAIGVVDVSPAAGLMIGLSGAGIIAVAKHTSPPVPKDVV